MGSPPPEGSKNVVLKLRSSNSMVIAPAKTGKDNNNKIAVKRTLQMNSGICMMELPSFRMLTIVVMKLIEPRILLTPARCREKMLISTALP